MTRKHYKERQRKHIVKVISVLIISSAILAGMVFLGWLIKFIWDSMQPYLLYIEIGIGLILVALLFIRVRGYLPKIIRHRKLKGELQHHIYLALQAMDSVSQSYIDEKEANKELAVILKSRGFDVTYEPTDLEGADLKVGNNLIEAKLQPESEDIDRLVGQLQRYSGLPLFINIVIYGHLQSHLQKRLEGILSNHFPNTASLVFLRSPRRTKVYKNTRRLERQR